MKILPNSGELRITRIHKIITTMCVVRPKIIGGSNCLLIVSNHCSDGL